MAKSATFLASKSRLDDDRMLVYKKRENKHTYLSRFITLSERLDLMGFPCNYLKCVEDLYATLKQDGGWLSTTDGPHWSETLDPRFHKFQGAFHDVSNPFDFVPVPDPAKEFGPLKVEMRLRPYTSNDFLNIDEYSKRLVGNAISVPVLEFCLSELAKVFAKRQYPGYDYAYAWKICDEDLTELSLGSS